MGKRMIWFCSLLLCLCCVITASAETEQITGGWTAVQDKTIAQDQLALFDKATEGVAGATYTPMFLLGTQVVAGTNYCYLCRGITDEGRSFFAKVTVYADLNGNAEVLDVTEMDLPSAASPTTNEDTQNPMMNFIGCYQDEVSQRAMMLLEAENDSGAVIEINWADSAFEGYTWRMHGSCVQEGDRWLILYRDAELLLHTVGEQDDVSYATQYTDGEGAFLIQEDGSILWKDLKEDAGADCSFVWLELE